MSLRSLVTLGALLCLGLQASAASLLEDRFEELNPCWAKNISGTGTVEIVPGGYEGKCLRVSVTSGTSYLTTKLDPQAFGGKTIEIRAMVKLADVKQGPQVYSTAKIQVAQKIPGAATLNAAARWVGTTDWQEQSLLVDVRPTASEIILNLGLQDAVGTAYYDSLVIEDVTGRKTVEGGGASTSSGRSISLAAVAKAGRSDGVADDGRGSFIDAGMHDLYTLPTGALTLGEALFDLPPGGANGGRTCLVLKGARRPNLPASAGPIEVNRRAKTLYFLQAAAWADLAAQEPCLTYAVTYADDQKVQVPMKAGVDVGNFDEPRDLANWKLAWQGTDQLGMPVCVGCSSWTNPRPETAIKSLEIASAGKGVPILLAISFR
ncbi:MAG: hypothetical protein ABFE16_02660 [Armatimonadia bacterium]